MDKKYACYCGLYCEFCAVKAKVEPAARVLHGEMKAAGFEDIIAYLPGGEGFWSFLKGMIDGGICVSCKDGGGDPGCAIRICAKEKGVEMCAFCDDYPCEKINAFLEVTTGYAVLEQDNALLRENGWEAWAQLQDERRAMGFTYADEKNKAEVESRCGLICTGCAWKESHGCGGCIETNGNPFHGECPVAKCCQDKGFVHCGECPDIPCELLTSYSYDKEHGDDGKRIEQCRKWANADM